MRRQRSHSAICILSAIAFMAISGEYSPTSADLVLTGLTGAAYNSQGFAGSHTEAVNNPPGVDLFVTAGGIFGPFINGPDDAHVAISIPLAPGSYTLGFWEDLDTGPAACPNSFLNLFFNGSDFPSISAYGTTTQTYPNTSPFSPYSGASLTLDYRVRPGAGTLSYSDGTLNVTLTNYQMYYTGGGPILPRVSDYSTTPSGNANFFGTFSLQVSAVPEPSTLVMLIVGLPLVFINGRFFGRDRRTTRANGDAPPSSTIQ